MVPSLMRGSNTQFAAWAVQRVIDNHEPFVNPLRNLRGLNAC